MENSYGNDLNTPFGEEEETTPGRSRKIQTFLGTGMPVGAQKYYREKITGTGGCDQCRKSRPKASEFIKKRRAFTLDESDVDPVLGIHYIR